MALVEKLVHDLDKPKAEVIVDVMIMETNSSYSKQLAATIASGGTAGLNVTRSRSHPGQHRHGGGLDLGDYVDATATTTVPAAVPATTTSSGSSSVALNSLAHLSTSDFSTSLPGALLESDADGHADQGAEPAAGAGLGWDESRVAGGLADSVCDGEFGLGGGSDHGGREPAGTDAVFPTPTRE